MVSSLITSATADRLACDKAPQKGGVGVGSYPPELLMEFAN
jgi:hypothetical protein